MKFKNDGENNALSLSLRFVDTLLADTGLIPTSGQLIGKGNQFWKTEQSISIPFALLN